MYEQPSTKLPIQVTFTQVTCNRCHFEFKFVRNKDKEQIVLCPKCNLKNIFMY